MAKYKEYDFNTLVNREEIGSMKCCLSTPELNKQGFIPFAGAEMDFKTAPIITKALVDFASRGIYGYTLPDERYLAAVKWWMKNARNLDVSFEEIIPTNGTIFSVGTAIKAFTNPGDGVIILPPVYYRYKPRILSNNRVVVIADLTENDGIYSIDFLLLEEKMSHPKNKLMILCNPHNPLGKVFGKNDLLKIRDLAKKHDVIIFSDEIFGEVSFNRNDVTAYAEIDPENGITCTSLGKVFNLTGVNQANVIIKNEKLREIFLKQRTADHFGSIDPFFYSALIAGYSPEGLSWVKEMKEYVLSNYDFIKEYFSNYLSQIKISPLEGGFTIWLDFRSLDMTDYELKMFLEQEAKLIIDEGNEYGLLGSGFYRMNIASPVEYIKKSIDSLKIAYEARRF